MSRRPTRAQAVGQRLDAPVRLTAVAEHGVVPRAATSEAPPWVRLLGFAPGAWWRDALLRRLLAMADAAGGAAAAALIWASRESDLDSLVAGLAFLPVWILVSKLNGLYDRDQRALRHLTIDEFPALALSASAAAAAVAVLLPLTTVAPISIELAAASACVALGVTFILRAAARFVWRRATPPELTLIVGGGELGLAVRRKIELFSDMHLRLAGLRDDDSLDLDLLDLRSVDRIIVALGQVDEPLLAGLLTRCRAEQVKLTVVPPVRAMFGTAVHVSHIADLPVLQYNTWDISQSTLLLKRALDIVFSALALVALAPLLVLIAAAIRLESGGPAIFAQTRAGIHGQRFLMYKFRTMVANAEDILGGMISFEQLTEPMFKLRSDPRRTRVGRVLRRTSLDELPQFLNILRGEMSLVGPRPEQVELVERYNDEQRFRLAVKPGLTGPMQVYGRAELTLEERLAVEREYIENVSLRRDLRIIALTLPSVFAGKGAY